MIRYQFYAFNTHFFFGAVRRDWRMTFPDFSIPQDTKLQELQELQKESQAGTADATHGRPAGSDFWISGRSSIADVFPERWCLIRWCLVNGFDYQIGFFVSNMMMFQLCFRKQASPRPERLVSKTGWKWAHPVLDHHCGNMFGSNPYFAKVQLQ